MNPKPQTLSLTLPKPDRPEALEVLGVSVQG